jgi:ubiquinone/menaquinone biosynthesis C-methylase UbiE
MDFSSDRSSGSNYLLKDVLKDPPSYEFGGKLPYYMDSAHVHVIRKLKKGSRVLEIGCGGGQNRSFFEGMSLEYVGVDISKTRVQETLQEFGGPDFLCDIHFLPFLNETFDLVYCAAVFEHLASPFLASQEVYRVLKPSCYFLGNGAFLEPWHDNSYFHMTPLGVFEVLNQAGFKIEYLWPGRGYSGYFAMAVMGSRFTKALRPLGQALYFLFRTEYKIKEKVRKSNDSEFLDILNRAKVAGAIDWISCRQ